MQQVQNHFTRVQLEELRTKPQRSPSNEQPNNNKGKEQAKINMDNINELFFAIDSYAQVIPSANDVEIIPIQDMVSHIIGASKSIHLLKDLILQAKIQTLKNIINARLSELQMTISTTIVKQPINNTMEIDRTTNAHSQNKARNYVQYQCLFQYVSQLNHQTVRESADRLSQKASYQLKQYQKQEVIDKGYIRKDPCMPFQQLFVGTPRSQRTLSKDQCQLIMSRINPYKNTTCMEFPQFNPDFQFPCTTFAFNLQQNLVYFTGFQGVHRESQLQLTANKYLSLYEIEGRFAFEQGSRWIQLQFDERLNIEWDERVAFTLANSIPPNRQRIQQPARAFLTQGMDDGTWDARTSYFYYPSATKLGKVFQNLNNLSATLKVDNFSVQILAPKQLPEDLTSLPPPHKYEHMFPLQNSWCNLNKRQLVEHLRKKFSPYIMYDGIYLPQYAHIDFGVTSKLISMMPRFHDAISIDQYHELFTWSLKRGQWEQKNNNTFTHRENYLNFEYPIIEDQELQHESSKRYSSQKIDLIQQREYGSNHFWTCWNRKLPRNQITITLISNTSEFCYGENPYDLQITKAFALDKLILAQRELEDEHTQVCYSLYINSNSTQNLEMALCYRRSQYITGYNAPYLQYQNLGSKVISQFRVPTIPEFITRPLTQANLDPIRTLDTTKWEWIPKQLVPIYDESIGPYDWIAELYSYIRRPIPQNVLGTNTRPYPSQRFTQNHARHVYVPYQDVSVQRNFRNDELIRILKETFNQALQSYRERGLFNFDVNFDRHQILLRCDPLSTLMEWDIEILLARKVVQARVAGLRDRERLYSANQYLVQFHSTSDYIQCIPSMIYWQGVQAFFVLEHLHFPIDYSLDLLKNGLNFSRCSATRMDDALFTNFYWFMRPLRENTMLNQGVRIILGSELGQQYDPNVFYTYHSLIEQYLVVDPQQPAIVNGTSHIAMVYRQQQVNLLMMKINTFPRFERYTTSQNRIDIARKIRCPQESRAFLRNKIGSRQMNIQRHQWSAQQQQQYHPQRRRSQPLNYRRHRPNWDNRDHGVQRRTRQPRTPMNPDVIDLE